MIFQFEKKIKLDTIYELTIDIKNPKNNFPIGL